MDICGKDARVILCRKQKSTMYNIIILYCYCIYVVRVCIFTAITLSNRLNSPADARVQDVVGMNTRADISVIKRLLLYLRPVRSLYAVYHTPYSKNNTFKHMYNNTYYYKHAHNSRACFLCTRVQCRCIGT